MKTTSEFAKITKTTIDGAWRRRGKGTRLIVRDKETSGLALIVNATTMSWTFAYRPRGADPATKKRFPNRTITLGNPASLSVEDARHKAAALKGHAAAGDDPHTEHKAKQAKAAIERAATTERLLDDYEKALPGRPKLRGAGTLTAKHVAEEIAHARAAVETMGVAGMPVAVIGTAHLRHMLSKEGARPATARRRFGSFTRFCDWLVDEKWLTANPCTAIDKRWRPKPAPSRSRCPSAAQLAKVWHSATTLTPVFRDLTRFLLCVPCRRGEAVHMEWQHVDLTAASWSQPGRMTKNNEPHQIHLHPLALAIVAQRHAAAGMPATGLIFPAPRSGGPVDNFTDMKKLIDRESGFTDWTWHDFRRSFATALGEAGLAETVLDAVLNHRQSATRSGVLGTYQRAVRRPEQVAAMTAWGEALRGAIEDGDGQLNA